jgi:mono/diheme cytochrome c family protein
MASEPEPMSEPSPEPESSLEADAEALFALMCAPCHGEDFRGAAGGIDLTRRFPTIDDEQALDSITNGVPPGMPAWSESLTQAEIRALVDYLRRELD